MSAEQGGGTPGSGAMSERMRALLSRAAEEQLLEQRQVSSVLGELRALLEDVDERLATGEQVERVAAEVRALSARVEARLDEAGTRSAELAERIGEATALLEQAAQDLAGAVAAQVAERVEVQLRELLAGVGETVGRSEQRLATHVDDAVLALAEVVLRRRSIAPAIAPRSSKPLADVTPEPEPAAEVDPQPEPAGEPSDVQAEAAAAAVGDPLPGAPGEPVVEDQPGPVPHDGYVLVPADVEEPGAAPAPPVQHERRTSDRRTADRGDGTGRRRRAWWRPV